MADDKNPNRRNMDSDQDKNRKGQGGQTGDKGTTRRSDEDTDMNRGGGRGGNQGGGRGGNR